jgi:MFS family permease
MGLLTGLSFALFYSAFGLPLANLADRGHRPKMMAVAMAVWSAFTMACGVVTNFSQMLLARVGVAIGEAGCSPPAYSLILDSVPPNKRSSSIAIYQLGIAVGSLIGMALGGIVAAAYGWRVAFFVAGAPGVLMAAVMYLTIREPRVRRPVTVESTTGLLEALRYLARSPAFGMLSMGAALKAFVGAGQAAFIASFFFRIHDGELAADAASWGMQPSAYLGVMLGLIIGAGGAFGVWLGGTLGDRAVAKSVRGYATVPAVSTAIAVPILSAAFLVESMDLALIMFGIGNATQSMYLAPVHAGTLSLVPAPMRAKTIALLLLMISLIGLGLGPLAIGMVSDGVQAAGYGDAEGMRWALLTTGLVSLIAAGLFWAARSRLAREVLAD